MGSHSQGGSGSGVVLSAMAGAVLGAAGLAWWLLSEAERRRQAPRGSYEDTLETETEAPRLNRDLELHDKVHELNQAIDDVRRQLEGMGSR